ncbi:hypothetical protein [Streptomyces sp. NBC_00083]|uniref:hypothetical protein n=1 Tax=Streptomyces sp. NBC_00083 TaxID=2975647 RepID=UPI0022529D9F|nr:hypothetical protein [Streptomyces sp. NBC_00083]MCX5384047.1 hypothetical protein [Streptomyces sp. NBC_00083]
MALSAVQVLTSLATGAATAAGNEAGRAVGDLVRTRLGTSEDGRAALDGVAADPADTSAAAGLQEAIREALAADPEFRTRMAAALAGPPPSAPPAHTVGPQYTGSIVIGGGSKVRNSQISLGPLTITNTRAARVSLTGAAALLVALLALGLYGGVQLLTGDDSPHATDMPSSDAKSPAATPSGATSSTSDAGAPAVGDAAKVRQILPDAASLPQGWAVASGSPTTQQCRRGRVGISKDRQPHQVCATGSVLDLQSEYAPGPGAEYSRVNVEVLAYPSVAAATEGFVGVEAENADSNDVKQVKQATLPSYGDESSAVTMSGTVPGSDARVSQGLSVARCGSIVVRVIVSDDDGGTAGLDALDAFTRTVTARAQQVLHDTAPTTAVAL